MQTIAPRVQNRYTVLSITTIAKFLVTYMGSSINIALPSISKQFKLDVITLGWISMIYLLVSASLLVPFGRLADIYGRRKIFLLGVIVFLLGSVGGIFANSGLMLIIMRAIQGVGGSAIFATEMAITVYVFPPEERGRALGINIAASYLGVSLGPIIGGFLVDFVGWQSIFVVNAVMTAAILGVALWQLRGEYVGTNKNKFDLWGSIIYTAALMLTIYGVSKVPDLQGVWFILSGLVIGGVFYWWETRSTHPVLDFSLFRGNRDYMLANIVSLLNYTGTWGTAFMMSLYLQYTRGFSARVASLVIIANPVMQASFSSVFGWLSERREPRILAAAGMVCNAGAMIMLSFITATTPVVYIIVCLGFIGFGLALFASPNGNAIFTTIDEKRYGTASAIMGTFRQIGSVVSIAIVWIVFAIIIGRVQITPAQYEPLTKSVRVVFLIFAGTCLIGAFLSFAQKNIRTKNKGITPPK
jgi:MFS family permease